MSQAQENLLLAHAEKMATPKTQEKLPNGRWLLTHDNVEKMIEPKTQHAEKMGTPITQHAEMATPITQPKLHNDKRTRQNGVAEIQFGKPGKAVLCPWFSSSEWEQVYDWLYSSDPQLVERGIARVAAWKARAPNKLPLMVETTADLVECQLNERKAMSCVARGLSLSYSMAITRFINGVSDTAHNCGIRGHDIKSIVCQYGIPSWMVEIRHRGTHSLLPSIGRLHTGAQFALNWLRANYWRPQRKLVHESQGKSRSRSGTPSLISAPSAPVSAKSVAVEVKESAVSRLTVGLCFSAPELINMLTTASYIKLAGHLLNKQLLHFPTTIKITVTAPDVSDLDGFPSITGDLGPWRKHLLKAADRDQSFKHNLTSALIVATHSTDNVTQRDFLCSLLGLLLVEHYAVDSHKPSQVEVVTIVDDDDQFVPGSLDWLKLLKVVKDHPGYYSHAICSLIDTHLRSSMSGCVREKVLYLSRLITLSERMGSSIPGTLEGPHTAELKASLAKCKRKAAPSMEEPPPKKPHLTFESRWRVVDDMSVWARTQLGVCPGQVLTPSCLDLPLSVSAPERSNKCKLFFCVLITLK